MRPIHIRSPCMYVKHLARNPLLEPHVIHYRHSWVSHLRTGSFVRFIFLPSTVTDNTILVLLYLIRLIILSSKSRHGKDVWRMSVKEADFDMERTEIFGVNREIKNSNVVWTSILFSSAVYLYLGIAFMKIRRSSRQYARQSCRCRTDQNLCEGSMKQHRLQLSTVYPPSWEE